MCEVITKMVVTVMRLTCFKSCRFIPQHMSLSFKYGEQLLSVDWKGRMKLFKLEKERFETLHDKGHSLSHDSIYTSSTSNSSSCSYVRTISGQEVMVRRPTLEEYVLHMPRGPAISYPKDIWGIIGLLDIGPGSSVMEAGSGSGALTLYLSRLVTQRGKVISFEVAEKHLETAKRNIASWAESLSLSGRDSDWINNVEFYHNDVKECSDILIEPLDAAILDLVDCRNVLESVSRVVKQSGIVAVYAPNISQIIQMSHHLSERTDTIPLSWESVTEFTRRHWLVQPAFNKRNNKKCSSYLPPNRETDRGHAFPVDSSSINYTTQVDEPENTPNEIDLQITEHTHSAQDPTEENQPVQDPIKELPLHSIKRGFPHYIARPSHRQEPHTAFIVKLRRL